jgi:hypothetical protein
MSKLAVGQTTQTFNMVLGIIRPLIAVLVFVFGG